MDPRISVVVNTLNEERNLPFCLGSVRTWADEIVVVDMHSDDRTVQIAEEFGARVFMHERLGYVEPAREFALAQATGDWLLIIDADEMVPASLSVKLREIAREGQVDIVNVPKLNYFAGAPLMYTGWGPQQDRHMRYFRRGMLRTDRVIHGTPIPAVNARILDLQYRPGHAVVHFNYLDFTQFIDKLNRYTSIEAETAVANGLRLSPARAITHAALTFVGRYLYPQGYRDGWRGFYLSLAMAFYRIVIYAKATERQRSGTRDAVRERYRHEAQRLLAEYRPPTA